MNAKLSYEMLIDYVEGHLDKKDRSMVEEQLKSSPEMQSTLAAMRETSGLLKQHVPPGPPTQYFSNFLPRLHKRIDKGRKTGDAMIPTWLPDAIAPAAVVLVMFVFTLLYVSFRPDPIDSSLQSIMRSSDQSEIEDATSFASNSVKTFYYENIASTIFEDENDVDRSLLNDEVFMKFSPYDYVIYDNQVLVNLNEQEIDAVVSHLAVRNLQ